MSFFILPCVFDFKANVNTCQMRSVRFREVVRFSTEIKRPNLNIDVLLYFNIFFFRYLTYTLLEFSLYVS